LQSWTSKATRLPSTVQQPVASNCRFRMMQEWRSWESRSVRSSIWRWRFVNLRTGQISNLGPPFAHVQTFHGRLPFPPARSFSIWLIAIPDWQQPRVSFWSAADKWQLTTDKWQMTNTTHSLHFPHFPKGSPGNKFQPPSCQDLTPLSTPYFPPKKSKKGSGSRCPPSQPWTLDRLVHNPNSSGALIKRY